MVGELPTGAGADGALPNVNDDMLPAPGTRPEYTPLDDHYRIDISSRPPVIDSNEWRLEVSGLVDNPASLSLQDLYDNFERVDRFITLSCISNRIGGTLISTTKWSGFRMSDFLNYVKPQASAVAMKITGADNFDEYVMLDVVEAEERVMFAYEWDDQPLKQKHGFPLRIYIPDRYGMKQPKWIKSIEFVDAWAEGYWVRRGWSRDAIVNTTSVVDAVATDAILEDDAGYVVPIGGIAYSGAKMISRVEVSVNGGDWEAASLRQPLSELTWVIWRYDWRFQEGEYRFEVRAYDAEGHAAEPGKPRHPARWRHRRALQEGVHAYLGGLGESARARNGSRSRQLIQPRTLSAPCFRTARGFSFVRLRTKLTTEAIPRK